VPVDVVVDGDSARVVEPETRRVFHSVRLLDRTLPEGSGAERLVNISTLSQRRSAPADLKKDAGRSDLPIALGLPVATGQVAFDWPGSFAVAADLVLTGETRPIKGVRAMALQEAAEKRDGRLVPGAVTSSAPVPLGLVPAPTEPLSKSAPSSNGSQTAFPAVSLKGVCQRAALRVVYNQSAPPNPG
jgi:hypothetical protein